MAEKHTVAMFVQGEDGRRVQVGWASPKDASGVRTFEYSPGYDEPRPRDVSFEDDELSLQVAEEQHEARQGDGSDAPDFAPIVENETPEKLTENILTVHDVRDEVAPLPAEPVVDAPSEELAADPIDAGVDSEEVVELDNGGHIVDPEEDEEAEFQRLLEEEQKAAEKDWPQTRREARENEENN